MVMVRNIVAKSGNAVSIMKQTFGWHFDLIAAFSENQMIHLSE
jgi:hypothetical protein